MKCNLGEKKEGNSQGSSYASRLEKKQTRVVYEDGDL